ncbi:hypothetical protein ACOSQ2_011977 [Xanthoceras sorbifolium]
MEVQGWIKLNIDGSRDNYVGNIAAGGVLTDATKQWITGLALNRGKGSVLEAEFWEIYKGLQICWKAGFRKFLVETDSKTAVWTYCTKLVSFLFWKMILGARVC